LRVPPKPDSDKVGGNNAVISFDDELQRLLRISSTSGSEEADGMDTEHALMNVFSHASIHPKVYATTQIRGSPGVPNVAASVMKRHTMLWDYIDNKTHGPTTRDDTVRIAVSIYLQLCKASDIGLCLLDNKPANILCDAKTHRAYLIDLSPVWSIFMDESLMGMFKDAPDSIRCSKTRGVQLYVMVLLLYMHLLHETDAMTERRRVMLRFYGKLLQDSCVPLHLMMSLTGPGLPDKLSQLSSTYFFKNHVDSHDRMMGLKLLLQLAIDRNLIMKRCGATDDVIVGGVRYDGELVSCTGPGRRHFVLETLNGRVYPCKLTSPIHEAFRIVDSVVSRKRSRSPLEEVLQMPQLTLDYANKRARVSL
jgi:hypothetical protein